MNIRPEKPRDSDKIRQINTSAFDTDTEANIVDALRKSGIPLISLVAEEKGELVGHILFSPVTLQGSQSKISIAGLAPMAVLPDWQNKGIGSKLIEEGLKRCSQSGYKAVVVLGYPNYYTRFGFVPSVNYGIKSEYDVPAEVFMVKEIKKGALASCKGIIKYHQAFKK